MVLQNHKTSTNKWCRTLSHRFKWLVYVQAFCQKKGGISLTKNQIEYLKLLETQRSNRENESIAKAKNASEREIGLGNLNESIRHNVAGEQQAVRVLGENTRHNIAQEEYNVKSLDETSRHNLAGEQLQKSSQEEQQRSNLAKEAETHRSNTAREDETHRSNLEYERERYRSNRVAEQERERSNRANEAIGRANVGVGYANVGLGYANLSEAQQYHEQMIAVDNARTAETTRANMARESETNRSNRAKENEARRSNKARENETYRSNRASETQRATESTQLHQRENAKLQETIAHNKVTEKQGAFSTATNFSNSVVRMIPVIGGQ